ncbi:MAG: hypothetical protein WBV77_11430 [Solirubrobacteraceae bacterium]
MLAYTKPKIVILDDDPALLDVMNYYFTKQFQNTVLLKVFSKSQDFTLYIEEHCYLPESPSDILNVFYADTINKECISKTLKDLSELSAIIILDQELRGEEITGIDLSVTIREYFPASYISMLTSNVPNNKAIELHNNHNIDLFVDKKELNAIHNLYTYLAKYLDMMKNDYMIDSLDIFEQAGNLDSKEYLFNKNILIEKNNPSCFLTLNEHGDIAMMQENKHISYWQFNPNTKQFIEYE